MLEMKGGFTNNFDHLKIQPYLQQMREMSVQQAVAMYAAQRE